MAIGVYVHLPFCSAHCSYCAFAISTDLRREDAYVEAVLREIANAESAAVDSIYFGGGTPSRTSLVNLQRIVEAIARRFAVAPDAEFSMEANPEDVTAENIAAGRQLGVYRLSIGVQSFEDA
jgi:oxygen-independent coproporphyrinogen-3 oxidase